jgi:hypothetical protein
LQLAQKTTDPNTYAALLIVLGGLTWRSCSAGLEPAASQSQSSRAYKSAHGNPAGRLRGSRNRLSEEVVCALLRDFRKHGEKAIAEVRRTQPGVYLKVLALLLPRQHKVEHTNPVSRLSDEALAAMVEHLEESLAQRADQAKLIEGEAAEIAALPAPVEAPKPGQPNEAMEAADTAIGPRQRKPRRRKLPSPAGG